MLAFGSHLIVSLVSLRTRSLVSAFPRNPDNCPSNSSARHLAPYINRVLQTAVGTLNTTTQRMNVLPGGPSTAEASNMINTIQQRLTSLMT